MEKLGTISYSMHPLENKKRLAVISYNLYVGNLDPYALYCF
jgi:hypothetical protein